MIYNSDSIRFTGYRRHILQKGPALSIKKQNLLSNFLIKFNRTTSNKITQFKFIAAHNNRFETLPKSDQVTFKSKAQ